MTPKLTDALQGGKPDKKIIEAWLVGAIHKIIFLSIFPTVFLWILLMIFSIFINPIVLYIFLILIGVLIRYIWSHLYWKNYWFDVGEEGITIERGVITRHTTYIQYGRIQNVDIWQGFVDRIFGLKTILIETAGGFGVEGRIPGIVNPAPIVEYIMAKAKGKKGLGDV